MPKRRVRFRTLVLLVAVAFVLAAAARLRAEVVISELMALNVNSSAIDEDGNHEDWIELFNTGSSTVNLNGWYLTDSSGDLRKWRFPVTTPTVNLGPGQRLVVWCSNKNRKAAANRLHTNFRLADEGEYLALVRPDGFTVEFEFAPTYPPQFTNSVYGLGNLTEWQPVVSDTAPGKAKVAASLADFQTNFTGWNSSATFNDSSWQGGQSGFGYDTSSGVISDEIGAGANLQAQMSGVNASCFIRYTFDVASAAQISQLRLRLKYDDAYICYLNGQNIAQSLAPGGATWNSNAIIDRSDALATSVETASIATNAQNHLVAGTNVLAFQLLNSSASNSNVLLRPVLEGNIVTGTQTGYLAAATPGSANSGVVTNLGPSISQVTDQPDQPTGGAGSPPLVITAQITPTLRPLAASNPVVLKWRVMYSSEGALSMSDAGTNGDAIAGDGIYTAQIPTTSLAAGQMLRWRVEAKDNGNFFSYDPPYPFPSPPSAQPSVTFNTDLDQYYGTVAANPVLASSQLPVLHWFVNPSQVNNTRSSTGASCSFYYSGQFYDNVRVDLHGQSSSGFPVNKKSHNVNFTKTNRFEWKDGVERVRSLNLLTNYADKTKLRNTLAWEAWEKSGHIMSHWCQHVRVEQNGAFWGVYDMVEDGNEDFLQRNGFNGFDALYKIYDSLDSLGNAEQKTREDVDTSKADYQAFLNGLNTGQPLTTRRRYAYDNVDIPAMINALAMHALINNNDWGHKNFYMFRNTTGTGEWSLVPWDQDLSSGHTWVSAQNYFNDEIESQRGIRNGANNRLKQVIYDSPELNRMFVRRMRTLMDEFYVSGTSTTGWYESRIPDLLDRLDPPGLPPGTKSDAQLDFEKWGFWVHGSSSSIPYTDARSGDHTIRAQAARLMTANPIPPYVGSTSGAFGNNTTWTFLTGRRRYLFNVAGQNPTSGSEPIPASQPSTPTGLSIEVVDYNPASGNADHEYFIIKNASSAYVDVSGWRVTGAGGATVDAVDYVFHGGTVIPNFTNGVDNIGRLHVAKRPEAFRTRGGAVSGGQFRLVVGPYNGRLSSRGGTIELRNKQDQVIATTTWTANPTPVQNDLRVSELNYAPAPATTGEQSALPGVKTADFEFIELTNSGATALNLANAQFTKGVEFVFPASFTLQPGQRTLVVANQTAFTLRYGTGFNIAGEFLGTLANEGETLQLIDPAGEEVLEFTYSPEWFGIPDDSAPNGIGVVRGYSLVTRTTAPEWDSYDDPTTWALSGTADGSPGVPDTGYSEVFVGWRYGHYSSAELTSGLGVLDGDDDGDGLSTFEEYAFGKDPRTTSTTPALERTAVAVEGQVFPGVQFLVQADTLDIEWLVEASIDGNSWELLDQSYSERVAVSPGVDRLIYRDSQPALAGSRTFRVRARYLDGFETDPLTVANQAPIAAPDNANAHNSAIAISVLGNDSDADPDPISVRSVGTASHGIAVLNGDGTISYTPGGTFRTAGADSFTYVVGDDFGGEAQSIVTVSLVNAPPVAGADSSAAHASPVPIDVLANDSDGDTDPLTVISVTQGQHGSVAITGTGVTYTPLASFKTSGSDSFTYTTDDGFGGSAVGTVTIAMENAAPSATADVANAHSAAVAVNVLANDSDPDDDALTLTEVTNGLHGQVSINGSSAVYTPGPSFAGSTGDSFTYTVADGFGGATIGIATVAKSNTAPTVLGDTRVVRAGEIVIDVLANDTDAESDPLAIVGATNGSHGQVTLQGTSIVYVAATGFPGSDSFTYTAGDGFGGTTIGTVTITNTSPTAEDDLGHLSGIAATTIAVLENDNEPDPAQILSVSIATPPVSGAAIVEGTSIRYTPGPSFSGSDTFTYVISDGFGGTDTAEVQIVDDAELAKTGLYTGLVGGEGQSKVGIAQIRLAKKGRFTGYVWHFGQRYRLRGQFVSGTAEVSLVKNAVLPRVSLELDAIDEAITATFEDGTAQHALRMEFVERIFTAKNPCPFAGSYTVVLPVDSTQAGAAQYPQGTGAASMKVTRTGAIRATGKLGDGTRLALRSKVNESGESLFHAPLYRKPKGFVCGKVGFVSADPEADHKGVLTWWKPAQLKADKMYAGGFAGEIDWRAATYVKPAKGVPIFGSGITSGTVFLENGGLADPDEKGVTLLPKALQVATTGSDILKLRVNLGTGLLNGTYVHPTDLKRRPVFGVLYQKEQEVHGQFQGINATSQGVSGTLRLTPQ